MRRGIIVLIWNGNENEYLKNCCPISLLNCNYKIITNVLASINSEYLPKIIHPNKKYSVKDRSIHDGASLIRDLPEYVNRNKLPGLIVSLDQTQAYDRVEWDFLFESSGMVDIKEPLLLIGKSSLCGGSGFISHYQNGP